MVLAPPRACWTGAMLRRGAEICRVCIHQPSSPPAETHMEK